MLKAEIRRISELAKSSGMLTTLEALIHEEANKAAEIIQTHDEALAKAKLVIRR